MVPGIRSQGKATSKPTAVCTSDKGPINKYEKNNKQSIKLQKLYYYLNNNYKTVYKLIYYLKLLRVREKNSQLINLKCFLNYPLQIA